MGKQPTLKSPSVVLYGIAMHVALISGLLALVLAFTNSQPVFVKLCLTSASVVTVGLISVQCFYLCAGRKPVKPIYVALSIAFSMIATGGSFLSRPHAEMELGPFLYSCIISLLGYIISAVIFTISQRDPFNPMPQIHEQLQFPRSTSETGSTRPSRGCYVSILEGLHVTSQAQQRHQAYKTTSVFLPGVVLPPYTELVTDPGSDDPNIEVDPPSYAATCSLEPSAPTQQEALQLPPAEGAAPGSSPPPRYSDLASLSIDF